MYRNGTSETGGGTRRDCGKASISRRVKAGKGVKYALKAAIGSRRRPPPPPPHTHLDIFKGAPLRLPKPLSDQFPVRVCSCPLCV